MKTEIIDWLINNKTNLKLLLNDLTVERKKLLASEDAVFHTDIQKEYEKEVKVLINIEISRNLGVSTDECKLVTETLNIKEYLNG